MNQVYAVTGANGHLGRHLTSALLQRGHRVIAIVRSAAAKRTLQLQREMEVCVATLETRDSLKSALEASTAVFHTAAPTMMWAKNPGTEIVAPILEGTRNLVRTAQECGVNKIIYTSTAATIGLHQSKPLDETAWNTRARHPQFCAKIEVERTLTTEAEASGIEFISVCPPSVLGPSLGRMTPSLEPYNQLLHGQLPILPPMKFHLLDVRDHVEAQIRLMEGQPKHKRYIAAGHYVDLRQVVAMIGELYPNLKLPKFTVPKPFFYGFATLDWLQGLWTGKRNLTWNVVRECIGCDQQLDGSRLQQEFNLSYRPVDQTLRDTIESLQHSSSLRIPLAPSRPSR